MAPNSGLKICGNHDDTCRMDCHQIARFDAWQHLVGLSPSTRKRRRTSLNQWRRWLETPGESECRETIERWLSTFHTPQTRRSYLGDLRAFYAWQADTDPTVAIRIPKVPTRRPTPLTRADVIRTLTACQDGQDRLAVSYALMAGLRVSEVAHIETGDVDLATRCLTVRAGKGGKDRSIPICDGLADVVARCGVPLDAGCGQSVSVRISNVFRRAGVTHRPHDLRATFATELIRAGVDLITVQTLLGHSSVATTQRYVLPDDADVSLVNRVNWAA